MDLKFEKYRKDQIDGINDMLIRVVTSCVRETRKLSVAHFHNFYQDIFGKQRLVKHEFENVVRRTLCEIYEK